MHILSVKICTLKMNLNLVLIVVLGILNTTFCFEQRNGYHELFVNAQKYAKVAKMIQNSPHKYADITKLISKSTDIRSFVRQREFNKLSMEPNVAAENVTELPTTDTTLSPTSAPTAVPEPEISELCQTHLDGVIQGITSQQPWALKMIDAAGKPPANLLGGGFRWLGDYEECLAVEGDAYKNNLTYAFSGQYCMVSIVNPEAIPPILPKLTTIYVGMCLPDSCSEEDALIAVQRAILNATQYRLYPYKVECQEPDRPYDTRAVIVLVVISFFIALMAAGTAYDITLIQWPKWQKLERKSKLGDSVTEADEKCPLIGEKETTEVNYEPGIFGKLLLSFSVYTNGAKLLNTDQPAGSLTAINGIRFISMTWVILGHAYIFVMNDTDNIITFLPRMLKRWTFMAVSNALVSVDTFFTLSGTLLTFLTLKELKRNSGKLNWGMFYFHRFWRLTPPYMLVLMVYVSLFPYSGSGPMWRKDGVEYNYCKDSWYYNLLYVNNFVDKQEDLCFSWAWYLANDMQFFLLSPLIILPLYFFPIAGFGVILAFLIGTWTATGVMATQWDVAVSMFDGGNMEHWGKIYFRPYFRMGPYLIGIVTGYILYKTELKYRMNKFLNLCGWVIAAVLACLVLYGQYDDINNERFSRDVASLYITVHRTVWGAAVAWVIFVCANGCGGYINTILSWKGFIPLSRLTYCAYLVHPIIIYYYNFTRQRLIHFTDIEIIYQFLGHVGLSYAAAFIVSLAFESPMMGLEKVIFKRQERIKK